MIVCKFGGSSISNANNIVNVKEILKTKTKTCKKILLVLSAIGKTTNNLIKCGEYAADQNIEYNKIIDAIIDQHNEIINLLIKNSINLYKLINDIYYQIKNICLQIYYMKSMSNMLKDSLMANGEILSGLIVYEYLKYELSNLHITYYNSLDYIITDSQFGKANVDHCITENKIKQIKNDNFNIAICSGFISKNIFNEITTIGRGGGDYSAALFGAYLDCKYLEIWTDVDGIMTSDPKLIENAKTIDYITYNEMMELSHYGANIIYAPTIIPLYKKSIPIYVKNTFNPDNKGTEINIFNKPNNILATAISKMDNIILIKIFGNYLIGRIGFSQNLFNCLSKNNINIIMISQSSCEYSMYLVVNKNDKIITQNKLNELYQIQLDNNEISILFYDDKSLLAVETNNTKNISQLMVKIHNIFIKNNISVYTQTTSDHNICIIINNKNSHIIHKLIYDEIY